MNEAPENSLSPTPSPDPSVDPSDRQRDPRPLGTPMLRRALWGTLLFALLAVVTAAVWSRSARRMVEPPQRFGRLPDFELIDRDGRRFGRSDLAGSPWIADFIFTRCGGSCPLLTERMARLSRDLPARARARLVSISVDPDHDTPEVLSAYAQKFEAGDDWHFLTGSREEIYRLGREGFKLAIDPNPPPAHASVLEPILHSTRFVLVDGDGEIRGYYDAFDESAMRRLLVDLSALVD